MILGGSHMIGVGSHSVLLALLLWQGGALEAFGQVARADGVTISDLPHDQLMEILKQYGR